MNCMKSVRLAVFFCMTIVAAAQSGEPPRLTGPFMGQEPPGKDAVLFADGFVAHSQHSFHTNIVFNREGTEVYWHRCDRKRSVDAIVCSRIENGAWRLPVTAAFSLNRQGDDAPFLSPDGQRIYFISQRAVSGEAKPGKKNIWYAERDGSGWSAPRPLPGKINSMEGIHWQFSVDSEYNLYFGCCDDIYSEARKGFIYRSAYSGGQYGTPEKLGEQINKEDEYNATPYIFPDGGRLLFSRESPKTHKMRIYLSRRLGGEWTPPEELSDITGHFEQNCPLVSPDGKYLFFLRYVNSFCQPFWMDAACLDS